MKPLYLKGFCFLNLSYIMDISRPWSSATAGTVSNSYFFFPWLYFLDLMDSFHIFSDSLILCVRLIQYCKQFLKILGRFFTALWFGQPLICLMYPVLRCFFYFIFVRKPKWSKVHHNGCLHPLPIAGYLPLLLSPCVYPFSRLQIGFLCFTALCYYLSNLLAHFLCVITG